MTGKRALDMLAKAVESYRYHSDIANHEISKIGYEQGGLYIYFSDGSKYRISTKRMP